MADCCDKVYGCRHCHDDEEDHHLNPKNVTQIVCMVCSKQQPVAGMGIAFQSMLPEVSCPVQRLKTLAGSYSIA